MKVPSLLLTPGSTREQLTLPSTLSSLHNHDCLLVVLEFLSWEDLNTFSLASRGCYRIRNHTSLDQTRTGTIILGKGVSDVKELMDKAREEHWSETFSGRRTHLRLSGLTHLSSNIEPIDEAFFSTVCSLEQVTSLDCSMVPQSPTPNDGGNCDDKEEEEQNERIRLNRRPLYLAPFEDYVDKGFAQGLALSLLVPNIRSLDISNLPLTTIGIAWLTENNSALEVIRWNHSLIWPISNDSVSHLEALKYLKEVYLDESRILLCTDLIDNTLWDTLIDHTHRLERVSVLGTCWCRKGQLTEISQDYLVKFVKNVASLRWFRSDLSTENIERLKKDRPDVMFVSSY